jgi:hypothetical protein
LRAWELGHLSSAAVDHAAHAGARYTQCMRDRAAAVTLFMELQNRGSRVASSSMAALQLEAL